jgi:Flp pilus assembly protein CpaB
MLPRTGPAIFAVFLCISAPIGLAWIAPQQAESPATSASANPSEKSSAAEEFVTVWIARRPVPQGTLLKKPTEWFESKPLPRSGLPEHPVTELSQLQDHVLGKTLSEGETVDAEDLLVYQRSLSSTLPKGLRMYAVKVTHSDCLAFQPGSRVCVKYTIKSDSGRDEYARTLLEHALLLAADPVDRSKPREGSGPWADTVTLAVTPEEAQALALALQIGTLRLVPPSSDEPKVDSRRLNDSTER